MRKCDRLETIRAVWAAVSVGLTITACGPVAQFTPQGGACPARAKCCDVTIVQPSIARAYEVVGVLDISAFSVRAIPTSEEAFLSLVRPVVCKRGGDAVVPGINGDGRYVLANVIKWVEPGDTKPACPAPPVKCKGSPPC